MRKSLLFITILLLIIVAVGCGNNEPNGTADSESDGDGSEPIVVKFGHSSAPGSARDAGANKFKEIFEAETAGKYKVEVYPSGQLGGSTQQIEAVQMGNQEMVIQPSSFLGGFQPIISLLDIPFLLPSEKDKLVELHKSDAITSLLDTTKDVSIKTLGIWHTGFKEFTGPVALNNPEAFKGLKFRAMPSPIIEEQFNILGATPANIAFSETYNALQTGTIDAQENPIDTTVDMKFHEVQDVITMTDHGVLDQLIMVNNAFYQGLDEDTKAAMQKAFEEGRKATLEKTYEKIDSSLEDLKNSENVEIVEITEKEREAFKEATEGIKDFYIEENGNKGEELLKGIEDAIKGL
ncbi:TRAP transporter substrate-binding protein [Aquibacillus sediminis]|uniref:TRAP transporter substrate-binding protein n=1 Tax=Aquibacillus sediminis TaxID=2574734 RepID=UPI001485D32B|nr:TRAP transporter substrate-binding protein [Aquibacillus sediminis]